jgi:hypothetical protein
MFYIRQQPEAATTMAMPYEPGLCDFVQLHFTVETLWTFL